MDLRYIYWSEIQMEKTPRLTMWCMRLITARGLLSFFLRKFCNIIRYIPLYNRCYRAKDQRIEFDNHPVYIRVISHQENVKNQKTN